MLLPHVLREADNTKAVRQLHLSGLGQQLKEVYGNPGVLFDTKGKVKTSLSPF